MRPTNICWSEDKYNKIDLEPESLGFKKDFRYLPYFEGFCRFFSLDISNNLRVYNSKLFLMP